MRLTKKSNTCIVCKEFKALVLLAITLMAFSCTSDSDLDNPKLKNHFRLDNQDFPLTYGIIEDLGSNYQITGRYYNIDIQSSYGYYPTNFIRFKILSNSTSRLQEGTYNFSTEKASAFWNVEIGTNMSYDTAGQPVSGKRFYLDRSKYTGTIDISKLNGNYLFEFSFSDSKDSLKNITGRFTDILHETAY
jgi:hypothetical protein